MKVHFAGFEHHQFAAMLCEVAGVRYGLFTVFPFIAKAHGINPATYGNSAEIPTYLDSQCRHTIMDSGIFTLMFGAHAGKRDLKFLRSWQDHIVEYVLESGYQGTVVEVDCQKILGTKEAWKLRRKLEKQLPDHQLMNVFHTEDGKRGLDRLIEYSSYLAISVPEARKLRIPKLPDYIQRMAGYIKNKKPEIKIHLLGCTQAAIMERCRFCDSCDSTSWLQVGKYGVGKVFAGGKMQLVNRRDYGALVENIEPKVTAVLARFGMDNRDNDHYYDSLTCNAIELRKWYHHKAGSQE